LGSGNGDEREQRWHDSPEHATSLGVLMGWGTLRRVLRIDHAVYAVRDLEATAERFRRELGLDSTEGGRHERWGTANRIVPFGEDYLELIAVLDADRAAESAFGRATMERAASGEGWLAIAVATDDLDAVASRLDLEIVEGRRERPDGRVLRWRSAGLEDPRRPPWLPFFIAWDEPAELHPGRARAGHGVRVQGIAGVELGGDADRLQEWLGGDDLRIRAVPGPAGVRSVALATADGNLEIR
jgi:Glyoxalase-like domain